MKIEDQIVVAVKSNPAMKTLSKYDDTRIYEMLSQICKKEGKPVTYGNMLSFAGGLDSDLESMFSGTTSNEQGLEYNL